MPQHDPRANILKWTLQSSATEHEQHRIRMAEMKSKPAMVQEIQDQELPHIVRSKIVLSGLRSSEQERHWQVELSRHKHSLKEIDHYEDTSSPQIKKTQNNNNSKNRNVSEKAEAAPVHHHHHHHHHASASASENQNPFSLKRFKVAAEIETQNERIMTNLKNVRPTVATARQCNDDAETRRRARRHFQRYPTPVGPPTLPGYENQNLQQQNQQQQNNTARSAGRSRQLPPLNNNNDDDKHLSLTSDRHQNNNNNNNPKPLSYMEQREFRERAWDSTTRVLYAQSSKGKSQPLEYMTIPSPLRNGGGNEISDHANNNSHQNENNNNDNNPKQRQLLTSSARAGSGIQPNNSGRGDNSSSDDDSDEEKNHEKTDALSVNSNSRKSSPERKSPNKKQQQNQLKPKPPAKNSGMKKGPQRINFLSALKQNPLLTQRRSQLNKEARAELEDMEDADRRRDIEQDEDDHWAHLLELERENNPQVLEQEYYDTITKKRQLQEEEARKQRVAAAVVAAAAASDNNNKSPSPANKRGKQDKSQEVVYTKELLHKLDRLCDIEDDERMTVMKQEERHYREWKAEESAEGSDLNLNPHVRMTQNFIRNRPPAALVRKMVLLRAKRHARAISRAMQYRHSRDQVLSAAIEAVENGILVSEDEVAARNRERRRLVEVSEYDERHDGVEGNEIKDRNELSKRQEMSKEEVIRRLVEQEKDRKIQVDLRRREEVGRPTSKDVVDRALQARERSLLQQKQKKEQSEAQQQQQQQQQQQDDLDSARREQVSRPASRDVVDSALKTRFDQLSRQNSPASPDRQEQKHHSNNSQNIISNRDDEHNDHDPAKSMTFLTQHDHEHETNNNKKRKNEQDKTDELMMESARRQNVSRPASREAIDSALRRRESDLHSSQRNSPDQQRPDSTSSIPRDSRVDNNAKTTTSAGINDSPHKISNNNNAENKLVGVGAPAISPSPRVVTSRGKQEQNSQQHSDRDDSVSFSGSENELDSARRDRLSRPTSRDVVDSALRKRESDLSPRSSAVQQQQQNNNTNRPKTFSAGTGGTTDEEELPEF